MSIYNTHKKEIIAIIIIGFTFISTVAFAALTFNTTTITSDGVLTLTAASNVIVNGNVGIGTTNPGQKFSLVNNTGWLGWTNSTGTATFRNMIVDAGNDLYIQYPVGQSFYIRDTAGTQMLRLDANGNWGFGAGTDATYKMDITGNVFRFGSDNVTSTTRNNLTTKSAFFSIPHYTNAQTPMFLVGGKASSTTNDVYIGNGATGSMNAATGIHFATATTTTSGIGTERMTIDSVGNVGIGATSASAKLDINSNSFILEIAQTPASSSAACTTGTIAWDSGFVYVCVATNTWKRSAIATW